MHCWFFSLQLVNAKTCEVGCAIANCPNVHSYNYYHHYQLAYNNGESGPTDYLVVCYYGPAFSEDYHTYLHKLRPYLIGSPCTKCPEEFPLCDNEPAVVGSQGPAAGLCSE